MWGPPHVGADAGGRGICLWQGGARRDGKLTIALTIARHCARPRARALHAMALADAGDMFSGAVDVDGQVWMWGKCGRGRLGYPPATAQTFKAAESRSLGLAAFGGLPVVLLNLRAHRAAAVTEPGFMT